MSLAEDFALAKAYVKSGARPRKSSHRVGSEIATPTAPP